MKKGDNKKQTPFIYVLLGENQKEVLSEKLLDRIIFVQEKIRVA
jgi:hypothetical protein